MTGVTCPLCGGDIEEISEIDGAQCETCGFGIRSDGSYDYSDVDEEVKKIMRKNKEIDINEYE